MVGVVGGFYIGHRGRRREWTREPAYSRVGTPALEVRRPCRLLARHTRHYWQPGNLGTWPAAGLAWFVYALAWPRTGPGRATGNRTGFRLPVDIVLERLHFASICLTRPNISRVSGWSFSVKAAMHNRPTTPPALPAAARTSEVKPAAARRLLGLSPAGHRSSV